MVGLKIDWHEDSPNEDMAFWVTYMNTSEKRILATIDVPIGLVQRHGTRDDRDATFELSSQKVLNVELDPDEEKVYYGRLAKPIPTNAKMPSILIPDPHKGAYMKYVQCRFGE